MSLRRKAALLVLLATALLQGCAGTDALRMGEPDPRDPWEGMNRRVYAFNVKLDEAVLEPVAQTYVQVLPSFARTGIRNFMGNLGDVWTMANAALQFKGQVAVESFMRVAFNSTLGLYGVLDIASEAGLEKHREDLGQTLGYWGVRSGPYLMLPVLGPSTVRDGAALLADLQAGPGAYFGDNRTRTGVFLLNATDTRARLQQAAGALRAASLDPYTFVRDGWLQKREYDIHDGNPPVHFDYSDPDAP